MPSWPRQLGRGAGSVHGAGRGWRSESSGESSIRLRNGVTLFIPFSFPESQGEVGSAAAMPHTHP